MLRYSLAGLFLVVLLAALACAALLYASPTVANIAVTVTVACLFAALLVACFGRGRRRAAAGGLALVGWGYLLLSSSTFFTLQANLLTTDAVGWLYKTLHGQEVVTPASSGQLALQFLLDNAASTAGNAAGGFGSSASPTAGGMDGMEGVAVDVPAFASGYGGSTLIGLPRTQPRVDEGAFRTIGQAIWSLLLGLVAALAAGAIYARGRRGEAAPAT